MLYNILLLINQYNGNNAICAIAKIMSDIRKSQWLFHQIFRSLHQPRSIASDLVDISNPHEYADICYSIKKHVVKYSILPLPVEAV